MGANGYLWLIPLLPLAGAAVNLFAGRRLGKGAGVLACAAVFVPFLLSVRAFFALQALDPAGRAAGLSSVLDDWIRIGRVDVDLGLLVDPLSSVMILVVTGVGFLIHLYSTAYMAEDPRVGRYFAYLNLFTGAMLFLVLGDNLLLMFLGWEGVGLCSYLLIGFWFEETKNAVAGMKAFVVNRVGDYGFTVGMLLLLVTVGTTTGAWRLDFAGLRETFANPAFFHLLKDQKLLLTIAGILLFVGATGKSAQLPLYVWLPDAMAGPTPVSALIHAATMVTAGVYMIARMNFVYHPELAPAAMGTVAAVGAGTALFAATIGLVQNDIKKVLAYSTVSQLGYMFLGVGVGAFGAGIFHVMTHAFFKACLFLGSGSVIHAMHHALPHGADPQDIRNMGGLRKFMPVTFWTFLISTFAIAGCPPLAGFFSKDEILWQAFSRHHPLLWFMAACAAGLTAFYMFRLTFMTFFGAYRGGDPTVFLPPPPKPEFKDVGGHGEAAHGHEAHGAHGHGADAHGQDAHGQDSSGSGDPAHRHEPHESPWAMTLPLVVLAALACVAGFLGLPHVLGRNLMQEWMAPSFYAEGPHEASAALEWALMGVSVIIAAIGALTAYVFYLRRPELPAKARAAAEDVYRVLLHKYYVDEFYQICVVRPLLAFERQCARFDLAVIDGVVNGFARFWAGVSDYSGWFDNRFVDGLVNGTADAVQAAGSGARRIQTGRIRSYLAYSLVGVLLLVFAYNLWAR
jgi:NADH-quinone oxidoreductase subunit L